VEVEKREQAKNQPASILYAPKLPPRKAARVLKRPGTPAGKPQR
jgi:hypothetical protein